MTHPEQMIAQLADMARRHESACGDGVLVWRIWGSGPVLVLGHGAQGAWTHWIRNIAVLARHYTVIAVDLPGHGESAMPVAASHASIADALAMGLGQILQPNQQATLLGFSMSGTLFAHLAVRHARLISRLVLIGCGGLGTPHGHIYLRPAKGLQGAERVAVLRGNLLGLMLHHPDSVDDLALHLLVANARAARLNSAALVVPDQLWKVLDQVPCPIDAIWGEYDRPHPDPALHETVLRQFAPDMQFAVVRDAGHWAMYERPEAFYAALRDMLALRS